MDSTTQYLFNEGRLSQLWQHLGAHVLSDEPGAKTQVCFSVWAPNASRVSVVGSFNQFDRSANAMSPVGSTGVWSTTVRAIPGDFYKFAVTDARGNTVEKADPMAFRTEVPPRTASVVEGPSTFDWTDTQWMNRRASSNPWVSRLSVYEVHLGSWRPGDYRSLAVELIEYVKELGFTHIELLPIAEHPFGGSWGYQVSSYYAPTSRFGTPDDFRWFVDYCHAHDVGVLVDWVPAHFPKDEFSLGRFDGSALYEHADPRQGEHPDWGTFIFNLGRNEVRNFLVSNALYWLREFHIDGLRVDAVASMLYLDYSRQDGEWIPNEFGGRENLESVAFLQELNREVHADFPGVLMIAEESTAWPGVSRPTDSGGLGFGFKWNMGWMHDTLQYFSQDPIYRQYHHDSLTFGLLYAYTENFVLPISHDEVVHGKGSLLQKMPGDDWQKRANLRSLYGWMWAHPGKQLLFMGCEFGQPDEWNAGRFLDWELAGRPEQSGVAALVKSCNAIQAAHPALFEEDFSPEGFGWLHHDAHANVLAFVRWPSPTSAEALQTGPVVCVANFSPIVRHAYELTLPRGGTWSEILNTDAGTYGGSNVGNQGSVLADNLGRVALTLPPMAVLWLTPADPQHV
jgi:1,4-alpha-glucan branching enzyme